MDTGFDSKLKAYMKVISCFPLVFTFDLIAILSLNFVFEDV